MLQRFALIAATMAVASCASILKEDGALAVVPYKTGSEGQIVVATRVNNEGPYGFAVDTGASITVVLDKTSRSAGLESLGGRGVSIQGMVASGRFPLMTARSLSVGGETWANARVASIPGGTIAIDDIDGVLGLDFLARYSVGLSGDDGALRLYPPALTEERSYRGWVSLPLNRLRIGDTNAIAYTIDLTIGAETIPALFDLGATSNFMNWRAARSLDIRPLQPLRSATVAGALETAPVRAEVIVERVKTGSLHWRNRKFLVADYPVFDVLNLNGRPMAIVGTEIFGGRDLIIDFARSRLLIKTPG